MSLLAAIEAGGTKFNLAIASSPKRILAETQIPTQKPSETFASCLEFFRESEKEFQGKYGSIKALGIGTFGPICLNTNHKHYGYITSTPKEGWSFVDFSAYFARELGIPIAFDTDVNASAIGEGHSGAGNGLSNFLYITIGTGIGLGAIINNLPIHGLMHPEGGHIILPIIGDDTFKGVCPYHSRCFEGLCSGPAIEKRWGMTAVQLPIDHEAWDIEAKYIAQALMSYTLILSPERIILGGGVMQQKQLFPKIRSYLVKYLNNYLQIDEITKSESNNYITPPLLGIRSGIVGALVMAESKLEKEHKEEI